MLSADGDLIYAVIRGTAENHGGHGTSMTAPNPTAQIPLLITAFENAELDPSTISYIETHSIATLLGDPIEINVFKNAFAELAKKSGKPFPSLPYCGIGSVKTNVGHLEAAAGMAAIFKVILAMQHQTLPALLHFSEPNPYIQLQNTPFYLVVTETQTWTPLTDNEGKKIPRRAGINAFGFGGVNAHLILEEYQPPKAKAETTHQAPQLIVLSAKNEERLQAYIQKLINFLNPEQENPTTPKTLPLTNLAYTLQVGREAMTERLAIVVESTNDLLDKLTQYIQGQTEIDNFYRGNIKTNKTQSELLVAGKEDEAFIKNIIEKKELSKLASMWVSGIDIDWTVLYPN